MAMGPYCTLAEKSSNIVVDCLRDEESVFVLIEISKRIHFREKLAKAIVEELLEEDTDKFLYADPIGGNIYSLREDENGWILHPRVWWRVRTCSDFFIGVNFDFKQLLKLYNKNELIQIAFELIADKYQLSID